MNSTSSTICISLIGGTGRERVEEILGILRERGFEYEHCNDGTEIFHLTGKSKTLVYADVRDIPEIIDFIQWNYIEINEYYKEQGEQKVNTIVVFPHGPGTGISEKKHLSFVPGRAITPYCVISVVGIRNYYGKNVQVDEEEIQEKYGPNPFLYKCIWHSSNYMTHLPPDIEVSVEEIDTITCVDCLRVLAKRWRGHKKGTMEGSDRFKRLKEMI